MAMYFIDPMAGSNSADGLSPLTPKKDYETIDVQPGDTIRFRRGSFYRSVLRTVGGEDGAPVTYSAYGDGPKPIFCGSVDVSAPEDWEEIAPYVWKCRKEIPGEVGNFVFNENECTAALRWNREDLSGQGDFWDSTFYGEGRSKADIPPQEVLLYSQKNPGLYYDHVECVPYGQRIMGALRSNMVLEDLQVMNSGVHGFAGQGKNVTIRRCDFYNIGGCVWNKELRIRFGNGVEFWVYGEDILVEECTFKNVYDSCVTHQGPGKDTIPTRNFICRNNTFDTYGMAAFEYRDKLPISSSFTGNLCKNAGCGFAMLGEELPRRSEIWPQPMGHHIFLWRIPEATEGGSLAIQDNDFGPAPVGAAIYSIISPEAEAQITLDRNTYTLNGVLLNHFGGQDFNDFAAYQQKTGKDQNSALRDCR